MLWFYENHSILNASFFGIYKNNRHKNKQCHMTFEGLSSVCANLEPAGSTENNEILAMNVLQKFTIACSLCYLSCETLHY